MICFPCYTDKTGRGYKSDDQRTIDCPATVVPRNNIGIIAGKIISEKKIQRTLLSKRRVIILPNGFVNLFPGQQLFYESICFFNIHFIIRAGARAIKACMYFSDFTFAIKKNHGRIRQYLT